MNVGLTVSKTLGTSTGDSDCLLVGPGVGNAMGLPIGLAVGIRFGCEADGLNIGTAVGSIVCEVGAFSVGPDVGTAL